ncbi:hypothetical protein LTS06_011520, partial [Exophiala xenobiotica]
FSLIMLEGGGPWLTALPLKLSSALSWLVAMSPWRKRNTSQLLPWCMASFCLWASSGRVTTSASLFPRLARRPYAGGIMGLQVPSASPVRLWGATRSLLWRGTRLEEPRRLAPLKIPSGSQVAFACSVVRWCGFAFPTLDRLRLPMKTSPSEHIWRTMDGTRATWVQGQSLARSSIVQRCSN